MNNPSTSNIPANDELDAAQSADVGGGLGDPSGSGSLSVLADAYGWLVDAMSEAIESIADRLR